VRKKTPSIDDQIFGRLTRFVAKGGVDGAPRRGCSIYGIDIKRKVALDQGEGIDVNLGLRRRCSLDVVSEFLSHY
jgi:hypothetical protein